MRDRSNLVRQWARKSIAEGGGGFDLIGRFRPEGYDGFKLCDESDFMPSAPAKCFQAWPLLFLIGFDLAGFGMVAADIQLRAERFHAPGWMIGAVLASMFVVQIAASPLWGQVSDRHGRKRVVLVCTLLSAASMLIYGLADSMLLLLVSRILAGLAAANVAVSQAWISDGVSGPKRTVLMARIGAAVTAGLVVGPAFGGFLAHFGGNRLVGFVAAGISGLGVVLVSSQCDEAKRGDEAKMEHEGKQAEGEGHPDPLEKRPHPRNVLAHLMILASVAWFSLACLEGTFARLLEHNWGKDQIYFGMVFAFESAIGFFVQTVLMSRLSHRFTDSRLVVWGLMMQGAGLAAMPFFPIFGFLLVASCIYSVGSSIFGPSLNSWCARVAPSESHATMFGSLQSARSFGFIVGPVLGGALFDWKSYSPYVFAGAVCVVGSAIASWIGKEDQSTPISGSTESH